MYRLEYHSTIKKNEILSFAANRWNWKIILSENYQTQKTSTTSFLSYVEAKKKKKKSGPENRIE
jgi:hypothetical protein